MTKWVAAHTPTVGSAELCVKPDFIDLCQLDTNRGHMRRGSLNWGVRLTCEHGGGRVKINDWCRRTSVHCRLCDPWAGRWSWELALGSKPGSSTPPWSLPSLLLEFLTWYLSVIKMHKPNRLFLSQLLLVMVFITTAESKPTWSPPTKLCFYC